MLSPEQCRAARGWLDWSQADLAAKAGVSLSTIRAFEAGKRSLIRNNLAALHRAFADAGIRMVFGHGGRPTGVRSELPGSA